MATVELTRMPRTGEVLGRAAWGMLAVGRGRPVELPDTELVLRGVTVDRERLAGYSRLCGFRLTDTLPVTYPHLLVFPVGMRLITAADFPVPAVGTIHIGNRIEQLRPLAADESFDLSVRAARLRPHRRGRQFDLVTTVSVAGEPVWREVGSYLRQERSADGPQPETTPDGSDEPSTGLVGPAQPREPSAVWRVTPAVASEYAALSGDRNPIHTSTLAARAFGYRRRIAHGMWTKARCLAQLGPRLPAAYAVEVTFRSPLLLPATVGFRASPELGFWLSGQHADKLYLAGRIKLPTSK